MKDNLTELVVVIDRSGSMSSVASDAIGGFNSFLKAQQELPGEANLSVVQFNTEIETYADGAGVKAVKPLTSTSYVPSGMTALYDAVGIQITKIGERLAKMAEADRPAKVIFAILTDGQENSSREYSGSKVAEMIKHQRDKYNWEFVFLAAGEEAFKEAQTLGMDLSKTIKFMNTGANQQASYDTMNTYTSNLRSLDAVAAAAYSSNTNLQKMFDDGVDDETVKKDDVKKILS